MTAQDYLERVWILESTVESKLNQVRTLRELVTSGCSQLSGMPRNPSPNLQPIASIAAKVADLEKEADETVDELIDYKREVSNMLVSLGYPHSRVLELRYINKMKWNDIAISMKYSIEGLRSMHKKALKNLDILLNPHR